ncbi:MAG: UbiX family flavin prenyltransferase [Sulfolobales archaeon]
MRFIVMITGASGVIYALRLLEVLHKLGHYVETIISKESLDVSYSECLDRDSFTRLVSKFSEKVYEEHMIDAPPSSSSYIINFDGFIVAPCSINTLAKAAYGITDNLINRVISNALRVRKKIIFVLRETPLSVIELRNALILAEAGGIILPASPGFYHNPRETLDLVDFIVGKILDLLEVKHDLYRRWEGSSIGRDLCHHVFSKDL